jgi:pimeloyl-ACP methyl ester carboxylesterase
MAEDVVSVLRQLNQRESTSSLQRGGVVLIGHSMGAKVVLGTLSVFSPEEIQLLRGMVLVAPAPPTALTLPVEMQEQQKGAYESYASVRWTLENVLTNPSVLTSEDIENAVRDSLAGSVWAKQAWPTCGMEEDVSSVFESPTVKSLAENLNVDVLVGELDVVEPQARVEADVVGLFRAKGFRPSLRVVPGVKHLVPLEAPDAIKHVVLDKY